MSGVGKNRVFKHSLAGLEHLCYKDAVVLSPHKLVGGPGSSGILISSRQLLSERIPYRVGGGAVSFVNAFDTEYLANVEELEEAGTPGIIQDIRAGLVYQLRD